MSLAWIVEECSTPFGPVRTFNWGVPDETQDNEKDASRYDHYNTGNESVGFGDDGEDGGINPDEVALESAQDQLGSVLWNSNTVALDHFCRFVVAQDAHDKNTSAVSGAAVAKKKRRTEEEGSDDEKGASSSNNTKDIAGSLSSEELAASKAILSEKTVLELGSGVGVLGIALSLFGGAKAAITDIKELVPLMEKNIKESAKKVVTLPQFASSTTYGGNNKGNTSSNNKKKGNQPSKINPYDTSIEGRGAKDLPASERGGICRAYAFRWGEPAPNTLRSFLGARTHYIVMCDALYGNPSEWPKLIQNLKEMVDIAKKSIAEDEASCYKSDDSDSSDSDDDEKAKKKKKAGKTKPAAVVEEISNTPEGEDEGPFTCYKSQRLPVIVNYCEQRVDQVEGAFLALLAKTVPEWKVVGPSTLGDKSGMGMEVRVTAIYTR